ncbi:MAG: murein biosynthesis integral membrane protein MurJ [Rickettsiales bacterium]|jgi:putative peptidoglycan lipid II flippase|nr:murein biosynthesis integral membrane protein MurJ [Rickettsiales bacterium]
MSIRKHFLSVSAWTAASRVLGFVRDVLIAGILGAGRASDIFFAAFKIPNMFRSILGEGALQASFVPMFVERDKADKTGAADFASMAFSWLMAITLGITIVALIAMPLIMWILAPGFSAEPGKLEDAIYVGRLLFPYMILITSVAFLSGILNAANKFAMVAAMPALLNIFMIGGLLAAVKFGWQAAYALSFAILLSGAVQLWILWRRIRKGQFGLRLVRLKKSPDMKTLFKRMVPGIVGSGAYHINIMIGTIIASLTPGAVSWLYYADRLVQLPFAIIGLAIGTILLTSISKALADDNVAVAHVQQNRAILHILFWTLPAFAGLAALAGPIVKILFQRGEFTAFDTAQTASAIALLSTALPAMSLAQVFEKTFFAAKDTKTPVKISMQAILGGTAMAIILYPFMGFLSVALGTALSSWSRMLIMGRIAYRRGLFRLRAGTLGTAAVFALASAAMFAGLKSFEISDIFGLAAAIAVSGGVYLAAMKIFLKIAKKSNNMNRN